MLTPDLVIRQVEKDAVSLLRASRMDHFTGITNLSSSHTVFWRKEEIYQVHQGWNSRKFQETPVCWFGCSLLDLKDNFFVLMQIKRHRVDKGMFVPELVELIGVSLGMKLYLSLMSPEKQANMEPNLDACTLHMTNKQVLINPTENNFYWKYILPCAWFCLFYFKAIFAKLKGRVQLVLSLPIPKRRKIIITASPSHM